VVLGHGAQILAFCRCRPLPTCPEEPCVELLRADFDGQAGVVKGDCFAGRYVPNGLAVGLQEEGIPVCCCDERTQRICVQVRTQPVRGHWRNQPHGKERSERRITWIRSYA
jgi:hypothetical protein